MEDRRTRTDALKKGQKVAIAATFAVFFLAVIKFVVGYRFRSSILVADAYHSGVDVLAVFASWFGLWIAAGKKSRRFPYGLYKAETFVTLVIGGLVMWAGVEKLFDGYHKIFYPEAPAAFPALPLSVGLLSLGFAYFIARKERETGTEINSRALLANASESFLDMGTSLVVMAGILLAYARVPFVEGAAIMIIASLITWLGAKNVWMSVLVLLDANLDPDLESRIENLVNGIEGVESVNGIKIRQSGPFKMVECEIATSPSVSLYKAHDVADRVEQSIMGAHTEIESVFVHVAPARKDVLSAVIPVREINGLDSRVHAHFGRAPYFVIVKLGVEATEIEDFYFNEFLGVRDGIHIGVKVIKAVIVHNPDIVFTPRIGEISFYMLKDHFIEVFKAAEGMTVREVIEKYRRGEIEPVIPHPAEESETEKERTDGSPGDSDSAL